MKTLIYITKDKVWSGEQSYEWDGTSLDDVFGRIRREQKAGEARIILGNDISFVTSMKFTDGVLNREGVLKMARSWMPFQIDSECFDWKEVALVPGEKWLQLIAIEKTFLENLSLAVKKSGIKTELVSAIGVLLAEKTMGREVPVILKWTGKENLLVVAVNGLADLVAGDISEEDIMTYTKQKWGLAVNPEEIAYTEADIDILGSAFAEKIKGDDKLILNLPILREVVVSEEKENAEGGEVKAVEEKGVVETRDEIETHVEGGTVEKKSSHVWIYVIILLIVAGVCGGVLYKMGLLTSILPKTTPQPTPTVTLSPTATPTPTAIDLSGYSIQILNGSGVTGEAAKVKTVLQGIGFVNVDTGNTTATKSSSIRAKEGVPSTVENQVVNEINNYKLEGGDALTSSEKYDLIMVLGQQ
jgi:hypothetical protein